MKKLHLLLIGIFLSLGSFAQENDPIVLTIDGEDIYASEFLYIYSKNNDDPSFEQDSLLDYMDLFINYKLKVKAAKEIKYDTIPRLKSELAQYRKQLSLPYMTDKEKNEALVKEAYDRTKTEVKASHILIRLTPDASPADTAEAYSRIMAIRNKIIGGEDFAEVAKGPGGSEDPSAKVNGGDLGYFSALQMVYPFEDAAFNTAKGSVSMPVRTRFGYHIIKVEDKRESQGMIETAHILILAGEKSSREELVAAEKKINEIYALLEGGDNFDELAAKFSDDKSSSDKGGLLPLFGSGAKQRMVPAFEEAAFAIPNNGEYSKPIQTQYGWHIIKKIQTIPIPPYNAMERELKLKVERDMRAETTRESFIEDLKKEYNYSDNGAKLLPMFYESMGDEIFMAKWRGLKSKAHHSDRLFGFKDNLITIGDFEAYVIAHQTKMRRVEKKKLMEDMMNQMVRERIIQYEDSQLETKYPEFRSLIKEYADGILVFEIMQDEIWKKASKDTTGIKNYYNAHRADFTYPVRYDGDLYICKDKANSQAVVELIESGKLTTKEIVHTTNVDSELNVRVKSQIFSSTSTEAFKIRKPLIEPAKPADMDNVKAVEKYNKKLKKAKMKHAKYKLKVFKKGINKPYKNQSVYYVFNVKEVLAPRQREFSEAKGLVTAAYQNQLEKEWLETLRKKYSIKVHEENLFSLKN